MQKKKRIARRPRPKRKKMTGQNEMRILQTEIKEGESEGLEKFVETRK